MSELPQLKEASPPAVLIVEDDHACMYLWRRYVDECGFRAVCTFTGQEALDLARRERPVLVVLDVLLPDIDGWEVLHALKTDDSTCDIPVLICSALREEKRSLTEGADGYLQKPILYENFLKALSLIGMRPGSATGSQIN
jgi:CheY-like chemotaxis protein